MIEWLLIVWMSGYVASPLHAPIIFESEIECFNAGNRLGRKNGTRHKVIWECVKRTRTK